MHFFIPRYSKHPHSKTFERDFYEMRHSLRCLITSLLIVFLISPKLAWPATAERAYIANSASDNVSVIDISSNTVIATVPVGQSPYGVAVNPTGTRVYITNIGSNSVSVIDTATNTVKASITVGAGPRGVAVNPAGTRVYVANTYADSVSVIDTATNTVIATVTVGRGP